MTENKRRRERWKASSYFLTNRQHRRQQFDVLDRRTRSLIGHLIDLSVDGFRIEAAARVEKGRELALDIVLPDAVDGRQEIQVKARCLWCMEGKNAGTFHAGFATLVISPPFVDVIGMLIEQ